MTILLIMQRGEHNIEDEYTFTKHDGYVFHDSRGFEAGNEEELKIVQDFVRRRSQERSLNERLHAIWFAPFRICNYKFTYFASQVLRFDGQRSAFAGIKAFRRNMSG
jgi:hypothetical protein